MPRKILLITGTQNRHLSIASEIINSFDLDWIQYKRKLVPQENTSLSEEENKFLKAHLEKLQLDEIEMIGKFDINLLRNKVISRGGFVNQVVNKMELNSTYIKELVKENDYNLAVDYGSGILDNELISSIGCEIINIHGGISPYFKGSSTLLYSLILLQPELAGMTVHKIDEGIDSGDIYRHVIPNLDKDMRPTKIFAQCQKQLVLEINSIIEKIISKEYLAVKQPKYGKTFMEKDFRIGNLQNLYISYENGVLAKSISKIPENIRKYKIFK